MAWDVIGMTLAADETALMRLLESWADPDDPRLTGALRKTVGSALPMALIRRYRESDRPHLLDAAIAFLRGYLDEDLDPELRAGLRSHLIVALRLDYERTGRPAVLEEAITESLALGTGHAATPDDVAGRLATQAGLFALRAHGFNSPSDLDRAIALLHQAVRVPGVSDGKAADCLSDLAGAWRDRFTRDRDPDALAAAVAALDESVALGPPDTRSAIINRINRAGARRQHAVATGDVAGLDAAIADLRVLVEGHGVTDAHCLHNLGLAHRERHRLTGDPADLRAAVPALREALTRTDPARQLHAAITEDLAQVLLRTPGGTPEALDLLDRAAQHPSATAAARFDAATTAAAHRPGPEALDSWRRAVDLLPLLAWRGSPYRDRQTAISRSAGAARSGTACAAGADQPGVAVSMLETGRAILWNQLLEARAGLDGLAVARPDLAARMAVVRAGLDRTHHG